MKRGTSYGLIVAAFLLGCLCGGLAVHVYRDLVIPGMQINNFGRMQAWQSVLSQVEEETGSYPDTLEQALEMWKAMRPATAKPLSWNPLQDNWGRPFHYARLSDGYVLASFGRDGQCDLLDLQEYGSATLVDKSPCYSAISDTVLTDQGFLRRCGK